jgi:hypothetical protein
MIQAERGEKLSPLCSPFTGRQKTKSNVCEGMLSLSWLESSRTSAARAIQAMQLSEGHLSAQVQPSTLPDPHHWQLHTVMEFAWWSSCLRFANDSVQVWSSFDRDADFLF